MSKSKFFVNTLADTLNASIGSNPLTSINANSWSKLVNFQLVNEQKLAIKLRGQPTGLLKQVSDSWQSVDATPLPKTDYFVGRKFTIKALHEITIRDILDDAKASLLSASQSPALTLIEDEANFGELRNALLESASQSLKQKAINTCAKLAGDALNGSFTITGENGVVNTFTTTKIDVATASPLWSSFATSKPIADMARFNTDLASSTANFNQDLGNGSTLLTRAGYANLIQSASLPDYFGTNLDRLNILKIEDFNEKFGLGLANPIFGNLSVDSNSGYLDANGTFQKILNDSYIYGASNTETRDANELFNAPINFYISKPSLLGKPSNSIISNNAEGFSLAIVEVAPQSFSDTWKIQIEIVGDLYFNQVRPFARMQIV